MDSDTSNFDPLKISQTADSLKETAVQEQPAEPAFDPLAVHNAANTMIGAPTTATTTPPVAAQSPAGITPAKPNVIPVQKQPSKVDVPITLEGVPPTSMSVMSSRYVDEQGNKYVNDPNTDIANQTRDYLTKQGQSVTVQGQKNFYGPDTGNMDEQFFKESGLRADLSISHSGTDAQTKFKKYFPEGDAQELYEPLKDRNNHYVVDKDGNQVPDVNKPVFVFRTGGSDQPYARASLDSSEKAALYLKYWQTNSDAITSGDPVARKESDRLAAGVIEQIYADNAGKLPEIMASAYAGGASLKLAEGLGGLLTSLIAAGGFGAGEFGEKYLEGLSEKSRGMTDRSHYEIATDASKDSIWAAAGAGIASLLAGGVNWFRGDPGRISESAKEAIKFGQDNKLPPLMPQQVLDYPILRRAATNARELLPAIKSKELEQQNAAYNLINTTNPDRGAAYKTLHSSLSSQFDQREGEVLQELENNVASKSLNGATRLERGQAMAKVEGVLDDMGVKVDGMFKSAHDLGPARYDLGDAQSKLAAYNEGIPNIAKAGTEVPDDKLIRMQGPLPVRDIGPEWAPAVKKVVDEVTSSFATLPSAANSDGKVFLPIDQINTWMRQIGPLTQESVGAGSVPGQVQQAKYVYKVLADLRNNPSTDNAGQAAAFGLAREEFQKLAQLKEAYPIVRAIKANDPTYAAQIDQLGRTLTSPTSMNYSVVDLYKRVLPEKDFQTIQSGVTKDLAFDPYSITKKMHQWDQNPEVRDLLMPKGDQAAFRQAGKEFDRLAASQIANVTKSQDPQASFMLAKNIISTNDTARYGVLESITKDKSSQLGQQIRSAIIDQIVTNATKVEKGDPILLSAKLHQELDNVDTKTLTRFLMPEDMKLMRGLAHWLEYSSTSGKDTGAALQAAGTGAEVVKLKPEAFVSMFMHGLVGKALTNPTISRWLLRPGATPLGMGAPVQLANIGRALVHSDKESDAENSKNRYLEQQAQLKAAAEAAQVPQGPQMGFAEGGPVSKLVKQTNDNLHGGFMKRSVY